MTGRAFLNGFSAYDYPFKNFFIGRASIKSTSASYAYPAVLNANGVPQSAPGSTITGSFPWPTTYAGRWKIAFSGTGQIQLSFGGSANQIQVFSGGAFVGLGGDSGFRSSNLTVTGTDPVVEFAWLGTATANVAFNFLGGATYSGMDKVIVCRSTAPYASDLADIQSEDISLSFNDDFLSAIAALNPIGIRPMDWGGVNNSNVSRYAYLPQTGYETVADTRWIQSLWAGTTTNSGNAFSCAAATDTPGLWTHGETIQVQFNAAATTLAITGAADNGAGLIRLALADTSSLTTGQRIVCFGYTLSGGGTAGTGTWTITVVDGTHIDLASTYGGAVSAFSGTYSSGGSIWTATLDIGSRGGKLITNQNAGTSGLAIAANDLATLVYDSALGILMCRAAAPNVGGSGLNNGVSVERQVALANRLGVDLWHCIHHLMDDAGVTSSVAAIKATLLGSLWLEYSNEVWNLIFAQTSYCGVRSANFGIPISNNRRDHGFFGARYRQIMALAMSAWGAGLNRVIGHQFYGDTTNINNYRFKGTDLNGTSFPLYASQGFQNYDTAPNRPIDYADFISPAPYYSGAILRNFDSNYTASPALSTADKTAITGAADDYDSGDATRMADALAWIDNDVRAGTCGVSPALGTNTLLYMVNSVFPGWNTLATTHSKSIVFYEGGFEGQAPSTATATTLFGDASYGGSAGKIKAMLVAYKNSTLFVWLVMDHWEQFLAFSRSLYPSWYTFGGAGIQWAMLSDDLYSTKFKSADAFGLFNSRKRRLIVKT